MDIAGRDAVLAAQVASPGTQVTIQFIAVAIEEAEAKAEANEQTLHEFLENRTIADLVEQFTNDENCSWLRSHDFFMGNNGTFATVREVSETSHDIMMGDTVSSDASAMDVDSYGSPNDDGSAQPATVEETAAAAQPGESLESTGLSGSSASAPRTLLGAEAPTGLLALEDIKPDEYHQASDQIRGAPRISLSRSNRMRSPNLPTGFIPLRTTQTACGWTASMPARLGQVHELVL